MQAILYWEAILPQGIHSFRMSYLHKIVIVVLRDIISYEYFLCFQGFAGKMGLMGIQGHEGDSVSESALTH